jgi:hypothetical protein
MFQNQVQMHAWHLIINHCIYVFWIITGGDLNAFQQNWRWRKNHWVDSRTTRREDNNFQTLPSGGTTSSNRLKGIARWDSRLTDLQNRFFWFLIKEDRQKGSHYFSFGKRNRQMGFQVVWDRQKGSRISILVKGGRQKGPHISYWIKGIARWDSKLFEIARRDLVFRYWSKEVARRDLVFQLWIKGIARWDSKLMKVARWDLIFHVG